MYLLDYSLDNLSLMALTLSVGFVVDDAIVMLENIVRHMENGEDPFEAALRGASEIGFTVISLTLSLIAVFIPLLFMTGLVGRMFREFALTLTIAVVVSAIVSLTLTPMMCSRILRHQGEPAAAKLRADVSHAVDWSVEVYRRSLEWVLRHETLTLLVTAATLAATVWLYIIIPKGFLPLQDTGLIFAVMEGGQEVSFAEMKRLQAAVEGAIRKDPEVTGVVSVIGVTPINATPNAGRLAVTLRSRDARDTPVTAVIERLQEAVAAVPGVVVYFRPVQDIQISTRLSRAQYQYTLTGTDAKEVGDWASRPDRELKQSELLRDVVRAQDKAGMDAGRLRVVGRLGVSMQTVVDT
jgi:multidrug efflux pump